MRHLLFAVASCALLVIGSVGCIVAPRGDTGSAPAASEEGAGDGDSGGCVSATLGDGATCVEPGSFKLAASEACQSRGLSLTDMSIDGDGCDGEAKAAEFTCCPLPSAPSDQPDCTWGVVGDGVTCVDPAALEQAASDACAAEGRTLTDFGDGGGSCAPLASIAKYACCE